jgi:hypothetical protein
VAIKFTVKTDLRDFRKKTQRMQTSLQQLPKEAADHFRSITPIRSGNARRRTQLRGQTIAADYPYAERLDQGYSDQAPQGMTEPTTKWIQRRLREIERGK